ncbi:molybdopterin-dependent oxidoreductase [Nocardioides sp. MAH-18]|uniref:Molybdopterin-dependent oxidoreductase n=1 Tax=Nocardioides agri TaxID=2682843 RepID=A0A6L6XZY2_9ACTN|nr:MULTISPECIES: molybdopterin-dependent oxidoreductase [unclassified Nocardioides]MBA2956048.1 molybdopterin-dependent oxidoreductase [Nocardioides sp. CGMCC 1.13656]MVQ50895.1 molybdopterin-dependent oxidoreductase [Nocardioides sp. MAH-18]
MWSDRFGHPASDTWRLLVSGDGVVGDRVHALADLQAFTTHTCGRWTGVPVRTLLAHAGLRPGASRVVAVGVDELGRVRLPLSLAGALEALVAWELDGRPLPSDDGYPARLVVPGRTALTRLRELQVTAAASTPDGTPGPPALAGSVRPA